MATDIKVLQLRVRPLSFKLARPLETAGGAIPSWPVVLLDLQTNAGVVGVSFVSCFLPMLVKPLVSLVHDLGTLIQGDPRHGSWLRGLRVFGELMAQEVFFVTRLKDNAVYEVIERRPRRNGVRSAEMK